MKNATKHAETLRSLFRKLQREHDVPVRPTLDIQTSVVTAALSSEVSDEQADHALAMFRGEFVDFNELRVATELEVQALVGEEYPGIEDRAGVIRNVLHGLFDREHSFKTDRLKELKRGEIRQYLSELPLITPFVLGYVLQTTFEVPAIPLDQQMADFLLEEGCLEPQTPLEAARDFCENTIRADDTWAFFHVVRAESQVKKRRKR